MARLVARNFAPYTYGQNVIVNNSAGGSQAIADSALQSRYPAGTWIVRDWTDVGFQTGTSKLDKSSRLMPRELGQLHDDVVDRRDRDLGHRAVVVRDNGEYERLAVGGRDVACKR